MATADARAFLRRYLGNALPGKLVPTMNDSQRRWIGNTGMPRPLTTLIMVTLAAAMSANPGSAQQASQHAVLAQTVYTTVITLEYDRPVARGRELFGALVEWDAIWTPGANRATWIDFSKAVTLEGHALQAGRYAIWMVPKENEPWEIIVVSDWDTDHGLFPYGAEVFRTMIRPGTGSHMEVLAYYFPVVGPEAATLRFHWGTTIIPLRIEVGR